METFQKPEVPNVSFREASMASEVRILLKRGPKKFRNIGKLVPFVLCR